MKVILQILLIYIAFWLANYAVKVNKESKYYINYEALIKFQPILVWYDMWIGLFYDKKKEWLYIFLFPCFGFVYKRLPKGYEIEKLWQDGYGAFEFDGSYFYRLYNTTETKRVVVSAYGINCSKKEIRRQAWKHYRTGNI